MLNYELFKPIRNLGLLLICGGVAGIFCHMAFMKDPDYIIIAQVFVVSVSIFHLFIGYNIVSKNRWGFKFIVSAAPTILDLTDEQWAKEIGVNLTGTFYCTRAVLKQMIERCSGKIVNIGSLAGELGRPITSAGYSSSKAGVIGFTMSVAQSVAKFGINVNAVCPGLILTEIHNDFSEEQLLTLQADIPFNREGKKGAHGIPQDVANAVLFLASNESDYITGTRIRVNGGSLMG